MLEQQYTDFARVYDTLMDNVDYPAWSRRITELLKREGIRDGLVLDLGCGTGSLTELLAQTGYDMIGVDASPEMLARAYEKKERSGSDILYLCQEMQEFELYGTVRAVISVCDSLNYILTRPELEKVFSLVHNYLEPGGVFLFDMNSPRKYREILADQVIAEARDDVSFIWENDFDIETGRNTCFLNLFMKRADDLYERYQELHLQQSYEAEDIKKLLMRQGFTCPETYDGYGRAPAAPESERILFLCRETTKQ